MNYQPDGIDRLAPDEPITIVLAEDDPDDRMLTR
jgi:hypothetical protein